MNSSRLRYLRTVITYDLKCRTLKSLRAFRRWGRPSVAHQFLFILCPPYAGSTLMYEIICSSPQVSPTNIFGTREGHSLPEVRQMVDYRKQWDESAEYPWRSVKEEWLKYWDTSKPVLMDKSPPNLMRAESIQQHFKPAWFIVMTRNPYAHCEGLMRRDKMTTDAAASLSMKCLSNQKRNAERLDRVCVVRYEDLMLHPHDVKRRLGQFIPELAEVVVDRVFTAHNHKNQKLPVTDFNAESIARLTAEQVFELNKVFAMDNEVLDYFGYELMQCR